MKAPGVLNNEVKARILELIQTWSIAFEGKHHLSHMNETYRLLRADGYDFPPPPKVSSSFVDSSAVRVIPLVSNFLFLCGDRVHRG